MIAVLVTLQFIGMRVVTNRQEISAIEINLAGRQRMLSQRVAWTMYRIASEEITDAERTNLRALLATCTNLMEQSHLALTGRQLNYMRAVQEAGGPCLRPTTRSESISRSDSKRVLEPATLANFIDQAWSVAEGSVPRDQITALANLSEVPLVDLLDQLDQATLVAQEASTSQLKAILSFNWLLIIGLVLSEVFLIFRPMADAVDRTLRRLKRANRSLRDSEGRLQDFVSTAAHQFWETDPDHRFVWIGSSDPETRLRSPSVQLGQRPWESEQLCKEEWEAGWDEQRAAFKARLPINGFEYSTVTPDKTQIWWRMHGRPFFAHDGSFSGYRGTLLEITNEREAEARLRLSERMQAIGQLTAGVAHDFNNILCVVQGNTDLFESGSADGESKEYAAAITRAVSRGASLTQRLLAYGRVQRLREESVDVVELLVDLESLLKRTLGESFRVTSVIPTERLQIYVDRHQLEDACLNIALNARDAAKSGGHLEIEASEIDAATVAEIADAPAIDCNYVCISFRDDGYGIPADVLDRIFEPFFTTKVVGQGTGLGLSMVYGFVTQSNGFIDVSSVVGEGTQFDIYLPESKRTTKSEQVNLLDDFSAVAGKTVLVVEDNNALRRVIRQHLISLGITVVEASDGSSALERLEHEASFDALFLDVVLPGDIDGIDLYRRAQQLLPDLSVLFCSGFSGMPGDKNSVGELPGPLLRKPFSVGQLGSALSEVLAGIGTGEARQTDT